MGFDPIFFLVGGEVLFVAECGVHFFLVNYIF